MIEMSEHLKRELECDAHNIGEAFKLGQGKRVAAYINKTKKDMERQRKKLERITHGTTR